MNPQFGLTATGNVHYINQFVDIQVQIALQIWLLILLLQLVWLY